MLQVICLRNVRSYDRGEEPKHKKDNMSMDDFSKQLVSRGDQAASNMYRSAVEDTMIITMKGVRLLLLQSWLDCLY